MVRPTSDKSSAFALRLPPKVKEAAQALVAARCVYQWKNGKTAVCHNFTSLNETINLLVVQGLAFLLDDIDNDLQNSRQPEYERYRLMMDFLMQHPSANEVLPENLPEGSEARDWLQKVIEEWREDEQSSIHADRAWVTQEFATAQRWVQHLVTAKGAVQRALT